MLHRTLFFLQGLFHSTTQKEDNNLVGVYLSFQTFTKAVAYTANTITSSFDVILFKYQYVIKTNKIDYKTYQIHLIDKMKSVFTMHWFLVEDRLR